MKCVNQIPPMQIICPCLHLHNIKQTTFQRHIALTVGSNSTIKLSICMRSFRPYKAKRNRFDLTIVSQAILSFPMHVSFDKYLSPYCLISRLLWYLLYIVISPPGSKTLALSKTTINVCGLYTSNICSPLCVTSYTSCLLVP